MGAVAEGAGPLSVVIAYLLTFVDIHDAVVDHRLLRRRNDMHYSIGGTDRSPGLQVASPDFSPWE